MIVSRDTIKSSYLMTKAKNTPIEAPAPLSELERSVAVLISDINLLSRVLFNRAAKEWDLTSTQCPVENPRLAKVLIRLRTGVGWYEFPTRRTGESNGCS